MMIAIITINQMLDDDLMLVNDGGKNGKLAEPLSPADQISTVFAC